MRTTQDAKAGSLKRVVSPRRGQFYNGVEWLACWLLDNAEGETITEEQLRPWAAKAWEEHLKRANTEVSEGGTRDSRIETAAQSRPSLH